MKIEVVEHKPHLILNAQFIIEGYDISISARMVDKRLCLIKNPYSRAVNVEAEAAMLTYLKTMKNVYL